MSGGGGERSSGATSGFLDFEVEVGVGVGREYPVAVRSPAGGARETLRFPLDDLALENRLLVVENVVLRGIGLTRSVARPPEERAVADFGQTLFEFLLPGAALARYDVCRQMADEAGRGLRLRLQVRDPALAALPWEFLFDPRRGDYVCLSQRTPLVRHLDLPQPVRPLAVAPPLRILGLVASPPGLPALDVARERERVERAIDALRGRGLVELVWLEGQTWEALQEAMWAGPWHIFHFVGHGGFDSDAGDGHLALAREDDEGAGGPGVYRLGAVSLGRLLADHAPLRLAVLNACEGARGSGRDVFSGTAATLVRMGLPAVVAMQYAVTDRAAIQFARAFYRALAAAQPADAAVAAARQAVSLAAPQSLEWATPVLYLRAPDAVLFDVDLARQPAGPAPVPPEPASVAPDFEPLGPLGNETSESRAALLARGEAPRWLPAVLVAGGWIVGWLVSLALATSVWVSAVPAAAMLMLVGWVITSLLVAAAHRWTTPGLPASRAALIGLGWPLCMLLGLVAPLALRLSSDGAVLLGLGVAAAGLLGAVALTPPGRPIPWGGVLVVEAGWCAGWLWPGIAAWPEAFWLLANDYASTFEGLLQSVSFARLAAGGVLSGVVGGVLMYVALLRAPADRTKR